MKKESHFKLSLNNYLFNASIALSDSGLLQLNI